MAFVSHALEWVRALLVGTRATSKNSRARTAHTAFDRRRWCLRATRSLPS